MAASRYSGTSTMKHALAVAFAAFAVLATGSIHAQKKEPTAKQKEQEARELRQEMRRARTEAKIDEKREGQEQKVKKKKDKSAKQDAGPDKAPK
jgi:hypothetical protein